MKATLIGAALISVWISTAANSAPITSMRDGNEVLATCESGELEAKIQCASWVMGVTQAFTAMAEVSRQKIVCFPESGGTTRQYRDIILKHLREEPRYRNLASGILALGALSSAFPCPKNSN